MMRWTRVALIAYCTIVAAGLVLLGFQEADTQKRLGPVGVVGPCREFGPDNPECRRQSRKILRSCLTHRDCLGLVFRLVDRAKDRGLINQPRSREDAQRNAEGGGSPSTGSTPSSPPGPPSAGGGSPGNDGPPVGNPPTTPPPSNPPPGPVEQTLEPVCDLTDTIAPLPVCP